MPSIISDDIFDKPYENARKEKYPYDEWTDGKSRLFIRGDDFDEYIAPQNFAASVRKGMAKRGYKIQVRVLDESRIAIRAYRA